MKINCFDVLKDGILSMFKIFYRSQSFSILILSILVFALGTTLVIDYGLDIKPCSFCIYQRYLTLFAILTLIPGILHSKRRDGFSSVTNLSLKFCHVTIFVMLCIGFYHVAIEHGIVKLPHTCIDKNAHITDISSLRDIIYNVKITRCDIPELIFGVSIATWTIVSLGLLNILFLMYWIVRVL